MSLMPIEKVKELDPHIDPIDVTRLMFTGVVEGFKSGPTGPGAKERFPDPLTFVAGTIFLLATVPIGGVSESIARVYNSAKKGRTPWVK